MAKKRKRKRIPPSRKIATMKDVNSARNKARDEAIDYAFAIIMSRLSDKWGWGRIRMGRLWGQVNETSQAIAEGRVKVEDLLKSLEEERGIYIR